MPISRVPSSMSTKFVAAPISKSNLISLNNQNKYVQINKHSTKLMDSISEARFIKKTFNKSTYTKNLKENK